MRCPDCNKFVPYEDPPEIEYNSEPEISGDTLRETARVVLKCGECGQELKEAEIEQEIHLDHECAAPEAATAPAAPAEPSRAEEGGEQFELATTGEPEGNSRTQTVDRNGKPITNRRYAKTYYGYEVAHEVKCLKCGEQFEVAVQG